MSERAKAWVLDVGGPFLIAVSEHEMVEVLETPELYPIPRGPEICQRVIIRHNEVIPLLDLARLGNATEQEATPAAYTVILAYQTSTDAMVSRAGLLVRRAPKGISVGDEMEIAPPTEIPHVWKQMLIACFEWERNPILVPDLGRLLVPEGAIVGD